MFANAHTCCFNGLLYSTFVQVIRQNLKPWAFAAVFYRLDDIAFDSQHQ